MKKIIFAQRRKDAKKDKDFVLDFKTKVKFLRFAFLCAFAPLRETILFLCLLTLFNVHGCKSTPQVPVEIAAGQYQVPIQHENIQEPPGWKDSRAVTEIIVPPSDKPTTIFVRPKERSVFKKMFPVRSETTSEAVASSKDVTVKQEPETPWWWYALGGIGGLIGLEFLLKKIAAPFMGPLGLAGKLISRLWRRS